jgi:molybdopterin molybdotransferase
MLELEAALARILDAVPAPVREAVPPSQAHGRVLLERVLSPLDLPPFENSAMDGYAVVAEDVVSARPATPVRLRILGKAGAGEVFPHELCTGACVRVFTGSPLPHGANAVVMQEDTQVETGLAGEVLVLKSVKPWENVRRQGSDIQRGAALAEPGERLSAGRMSLLGAVGLAAVAVGRQPVTGVLATGSELKEPGQPLGPGQIYDSNRIGLHALTQSCGAVPKMLPLVTDTLAATRDALRDAFNQCDVVVTSGGVSVGDMDFLKPAFEQSGGHLDFWQVAIKPGRPFVFGRLGGKLLFGLPGNPVSAMITFLLLARPALLRWQGAIDVSLPGHPGVLAERLANPGDRRHFLRVRVDAAGLVRSAGLQASHALSSLASANALLDLPPQTTLPAGATVRVLRTDC